MYTLVWTAAFTARRNDSRNSIPTCGRSSPQSWMIWKAIRSSRIWIITL